MSGPAVDVRIRGVNVSYGSNHVLKGVNLHVAPGEFFAFLGPSGCGKTTLLRLIAGFNRADTGEVLIGGKDVLALPPWRRDVGMVFQSYALWPHMTVAQNIAFGLEERRRPRAEVARRVSAALELVGLGALAHRRPAQLSGGQQQRVAVARTVAVEPKVLLLDEPLSNLDARMRVQVRRELRDMQRRLGLTTIFVTHDQEEANTVCDRIAVMHDGVVQQVGTPMELYERPANLFVAGFLGTANILDGCVVGAGADRAFELAGGICLPMPPSATMPPGAKLVFRPQDAAIGPARPGAAQVPGTVAHREFLGASVRYGVRIGAAEVFLDAPFRAGNPLHEVGAIVSVSLGWRPRCGSGHRRTNRHDSVLPSSRQDFDSERDGMRQRHIGLCLVMAASLLLPALLGVGDASARPVDTRAERNVSQPVRRPAARPAPRKPALATRPPVRTLPLVVVDAGHGGVDGGAVGAGGTPEKAVTLAAAQELARQLRATGRYRVLLTRDNDRFVPLAARAGLAVAHGAALMVSIHADASPNRQARGASVYARPAQSAGPDVARLPASRGSSRAIARALSEPARPDEGSTRLQLAMVASLDDEVGMVPDPARQGRFRVLSSLGIPSVLVEMGFISNRQDEALLRQPRHRAVIARAIRDAVDDYFAGRGRPASRT